MADRPAVARQDHWPAGLRRRARGWPPVRAPAAWSGLGRLPHSADREGYRGGGRRSARARRGGRPPLEREQSSGVRAEERTRRRRERRGAGSSAIGNGLAQPQGAVARARRSGERCSHLAAALAVLWGGREALAQVLGDG